MTTRFDLIVVGAGTAGLPAAIFAAQRGAKVLLLEAAPEIGGTLILSSGMMAAAGTKLQAKLGISDSPQAHYDDVMRISQGTADPALVRLTADHAAATYDWLADNGFEPLPGQPVFGQAHEPYLTRRYVWGADGGRSILAVLRRQLEPQLANGRITLKVSTPVTSLVLADSGAVEGVRVAENAQGGASEAVYRARHVVLTAGGYASNPSLFEALNGVRQYSRLAYPFSKGDGIQLGLSVGGSVRGRAHYLSNFGSILADENYPTTMLARWLVTPEKRLPWEIYLNARGERFVREDEPSIDAREHALREQPELRYWIVFDQAILDAAPIGIPGWTREELEQKFNTHPMFLRADSLAELAERAGLPAAAVEASVAQYNQGLRDRHDAFGRVHLPLPLGRAPFYAVRHQGHSITSTVGLVVDAQLRVLRAGGEPVPNLYAAGEILGSGQTMGKAFVGGMMATPALTFGRLLGSSLPIGHASA